MLTQQKALSYLGIDYADDLIRDNVDRCIAAAKAVLLGAIGSDVLDHFADDPRILELELIYMEDLYSQRGIGAKVSGATRRLVACMELQLRIELRMKKEAAGL